MNHLAKRTKYMFYHRPKLHDDIYLYFFNLVILDISFFLFMEIGSDHDSTVPSLTIYLNIFKSSRFLAHICNTLYHWLVLSNEAYLQRTLGFYA